MNNKKEIMTEYKIGEIISREPVVTVDFSKPIFFNDDVFGRIYNQHDATYLGSDQRGRRVLVADYGGVNIDAEIICDEQGIQEGDNEPTVFNR